MPKRTLVLNVMMLKKTSLFYISINKVPVNKDNSFLSDYHYIDHNYNEIVHERDEFNKKFDLSLMLNNYGEKVEVINPTTGVKTFFPYGFKAGENSFSFSIFNKNKEAVNNAKVKILLTRFETNNYDKPLEIASVENGTYKIKPFSIEKVGRWKIILSVEIDKYKNIYEYKVFAQ